MNVLSMVLTVNSFFGIRTLTTFDVGLSQASFTVTVTSIYCTEPVCAYASSFAGDWLTHVMAPPQPSEEAATTVLSKSGILYLHVPAASASTVSLVPMVPIVGPALSSTVIVFVAVSLQPLLSDKYNVTVYVVLHEDGMVTAALSLVSDVVCVAMVVLPDFHVYT